MVDVECSFWSKEMVDVMRDIGNVKSNQIYNGLGRAPPASTEDTRAMTNYIRDKYEYRKFQKKEVPTSPPLPRRTGSAAQIPTSASPTLPRRPDSSQRTAGSSQRTAGPPIPARTNSSLQQLSPVKSPQQSSAWGDLIDMSDAPSTSQSTNAQPSALPPMQSSYQTSFAQPAQKPNIFASVAPQSAKSPFQQQQKQQRQTNPFFAMQSPSFVQTNPFNQPQQQQYYGGQQMQYPQQPQQPTQNYWNVQ